MDWRAPGAATQLSSTHRAPVLAQSGAAILLGVGAEDPYPTRDPAERLADAVLGEGGIVEVRVVPNVAHAFVDEPGEALLRGPKRVRSTNSRAGG